MDNCEYCGKSDDVCTCYDTASDLRGYLDDAYAENEKLRARVEKLEKHSIEWIPVTERLPEKDGYVLTHSRGGSIRTECFFSDPCWHSQKTFGARRGMAEAYGEASVHFAHALEYGYAITHWAAYPNTPEAALAAAEVKP